MAFNRGPGEHLQYSFRKSILEEEKTFELTNDSLSITSDKSTLQIPFSCIKKVHLKFDPIRWNTGRFTCEITSTSNDSSAKKNQVLQLTNSHFVGIANFENRNQTYRDFIKALHLKVAANSRIRFVKGLTPLVYFFYIALSLISLFTAFWAISMLNPSADGNIPIRIGLIIFYGFFSVIYFKKNRPGRYDPIKIDKKLLP